MDYLDANSRDQCGRCQRRRIRFDSRIRLLGKPLRVFSDDCRLADPRGLGVDHAEGLLPVNSGTDRILAFDSRRQVVRDSGGKTAEAEQLLLSVYIRFSEGFESRDLKTARALIDELRKPSADSERQTPDRFQTRMPRGGAARQRSSFGRTDRQTFHLSPIRRNI